MTHADVVDHDDGEVETGLDDEQEVGVDVQVAEEDDGRAVDEVVDVREYLEGENDELECGTDEVHVADDGHRQRGAQHRRMTLRHRVLSVRRLLLQQRS